MTLADNYVPTKTLAAAGVTEFTFSWTAISASFVKPYSENVATGVQTLLTSGFTVTLNASGVGGKVTFTTAPYSATDNVYIIITRDVPYTQETAYSTSTGFPATTIETDMSLKVAMAQQNKELASRSLSYPVGTSSSVSSNIPAPSAGKSLKGNATNDGWELTVGDPDDAEVYAAAALVSANASASSANLSASSATDAQTAQGLAEDARDAAIAAAGTFTLASQAEAEAGTDNTKYMSSLRVAQAISEQAATKTYVEERDKYIESIHALSVSWSASAWVDVDVSAYVPSGTKRVLLYVESNDTTTSQYLTFRKNGGTYSYGTVRQHVANVKEFAQIMVPVDSSRVFEAYSQAGSATTRDVTLLGYWI